MKHKHDLRNARIMREKASSMNPPALSTSMPRDKYNKAQKAERQLLRESDERERAARLLKEDRERYVKLPDPFCRHCKKRKPCGC